MGQKRQPNYLLSARNKAHWQTLSQNIKVNIQKEIIKKEYHLQQEEREKGRRQRMNRFEITLLK